MVDAEIVKKRGRPSKGDSTDGQSGQPATGAGAHDLAEGQTVGHRVMVTWANFDKALYKWEFDNKEKRITRVYFDGECPNAYSGCYSEAPVHHGKPSVMLSTGDVIEI